MWPWHTRYAILVLGAATALGAYNWICWSALTSSDWATWVGSIGTVGAFLGTIWLATTAERRRRQEARDLALVAAASIALKISRVANAVQGTIDFLEDAFNEGYGYNCQSLANALRDAGMWTDAEILPLIILRKGVTANLAGSRTSIEHCCAMLITYAQNSQVLGNNIAGVSQTLLPYLYSVRASLSVAQSECRRFVMTPPHRDY